MSVDQHGHYAQIHQNYHSINQFGREAHKRKLLISKRDGGKKSKIVETGLIVKIDKIISSENAIKKKLELLEKSVNTHKNIFASKSDTSQLNIVLQDINKKLNEYDLKNISTDIINNKIKVDSEINKILSDLKKIKDFISTLNIEVGPNQIKFKSRVLREVKDAVFDSDAVNYHQFKKLTDQINPLLEKHKLILASHTQLIGRTILPHPSDLNTYLACNRRITNLAPPTSSSDAVTLEYMSDYFKTNIESLDKQIKILLSDKN